MTLSRARFLTSASTTHQGASGMSVAASIASLARVQRLGDALDRPSLARGVAAFEDQDHSKALGPDELLLLDQLHLQPDQLALVVLGAHSGSRPRSLLDRRLRLGSRHGWRVLP